MKQSHAALQWITDELTERNIPFAIVGGLAANAYGATRPLNDIDIDVPDAVLPVLAVELREYLAFGPDRAVSECFDCALVGFTFGGQEIELSGAESMKILDRSSGEWLDWPTDLAAVESRHLLGITVPVMAREPLIAYKRLAGRDTDLADVQEIESLPQR